MLSTDDKIEIQELIARFAHCSDFADWDGLAQLFTEDVVTEITGSAWKFEGIEAQIEHARASDEQAQGKNRHYYFNICTRVEGETVVADYVLVNVNAGHLPMAAQIVVTGRHQDRVVKTAEGWKFAHRLVTFDQNVHLTF